VNAPEDRPRSDSVIRRCLLDVRFAPKSGLKSVIAHPTSAVIAAIRRTDVTEYRPASGSTSLRLDVEGPDDVAPLLGFVGDVLAEIGRRANHHCAA
jgi:hypothetical protein